MEQSQDQAALHGQDPHQHAPPQVQQPVHIPQQGPIAPLQAADGTFTCQWVNCGERAINAEQLYVCNAI